MTKICGKCKILKDLSEFYKGSGKYNRQSMCKKCHKIWHDEYYHTIAKFKYDPRKNKNSRIKNKYGMTIEQFEERLRQQDEKCFICHKPEGVTKVLAIDHNHHTGTVRNLLCQKCNRALGLVNEDPEILQNMLDYLESWYDYECVSELPNN